tara:strand:+ start:1306 stop:2022 length:717 start_codon:yes stop_codon:yes gene_type:complete
MHEKRNFILILLVTVGLFWSAWAWFYTSGDGFTFMRIASTLFTIIVASWLTYGMTLEDRLPDMLLDIIGSHYFEADGICLFPVIRNSEAGPELSIYYQNRFENPASVVVHLRPTGDSFEVVSGASDVHIAFRVGGGNVGIIHQPINVPPKLQGEIVELKMVAVSHFPRSHGTRWRRREGRPCGSMQVDWAGNAMKTGAHEVDGTIELKNPVTLHLAMPKVCYASDGAHRSWRQELLSG